MVGGVVTKCLRIVFNRLPLLIKFKMCALVREHGELWVFIHLMQSSVQMFAMVYRSGYQKASE